MVTSVASTTSSSSSSSAANTAAATFSKNFDTFLKLLTTQLKNQDPLNPMDSKDFTQQLVQYSGVEQGINTNKNLEKLISMYQTTQNSSMAGYIGMDVKAKGDTTALVNNSATWNYTTPVAAQSVTIKVYDSNDQVVWQGTGDPSVGEHVFTWDGKDSNGTQMPAGNYRIGVTGKNAGNENAFTAETSILGRVDGIESVNGENMLTVGSLRINLADVLSVKKSA